MPAMRASASACEQTRRGAARERRWLTQVDVGQGDVDLGFAQQRPSDVDWILVAGLSDQPDGVDEDTHAAAEDIAQLDDLAIDDQPPVGVNHGVVAEVGLGDVATLQRGDGEPSDDLGRQEGPAIRVASHVWYIAQ